MHTTSRHGRTAAWIAFPLAVVASGALIATASYAAFSSSTDNAANSWRTGAVSLTDDDALAEHVGLTVERGSLGTPDDCSTFTTTTTVHDGTLAGLMASESFGTGVDAWKPTTGTASTTYRVSYDLSEAAPNTVQSSEAGTTFVWEAQTD
jgi:hypothetical protein